MRVIGIELGTGGYFFRKFDNVKKEKGVINIYLFKFVFLIIKCDF